MIRPKGRKFGKKFENVVNGEHTYRFDPYENRQGKTSYNRNYQKWFNYRLKAIIFLIMELKLSKAETII